jgi:methylenetetrahydrofolate--tRNA-(uracil-5-)-methyltransferase
MKGHQITIIGGGLAGSEAAWRLGCEGVKVRLIEMRPHKSSPAHQSPHLGELVCSNSLRSAILASGPGLLKEELRILDSLVIEAADRTAVPAGKALAVDRELFARRITEKLENHPFIEIERGEITSAPQEQEGPTIIATGPLTSDPLAQSVAGILGHSGLHFYDAIAPIVTADSLNMEILFRASRHLDGEGDYLNSAMDEPTYRAFVNAIISAEKIELRPFEDIKHFEGCLPVEVLASRGPDTLAFGPMKPVGLTDPGTGKRPFAVVQLRAENHERTLYNLVGFQTKMTYAEQKRVFRMIPGLEKAQFVRLGAAHRNTYLDSPNLLDMYSRSRQRPDLFFAGQITGVEGYIESTASGLAVAIMALSILRGMTPILPSSETAIGALLKHTRSKPAKSFEPMNINFGIMDSAPKGTPKKNRKEVVARRALLRTREWKNNLMEQGMFRNSD